MRLKSREVRLKSGEVRLRGGGGGFTLIIL